MKIGVDQEVEVSTEPRESLSAQSIKQLAMDVHAGLIVGSWNVPENDIGMVFMPLMLMSEVNRKELERDGVVQVFEYVEKAGPRGINGMPCFFSFRTLKEDEFTLLIKYHKQVKAMSEAFLGEDDV